MQSGATDAHDPRRDVQGLSIRAGHTDMVGTQSQGAGLLGGIA